MKQFILEIYEPGSTSDPAVVFESDQPFMAFSRGDLINPRTWPNNSVGNVLLRIVAIEHLFWEASLVIKHKVLIYTDTVDDVRESRVNSK